MKFTLKIETNNEAMQTGGDVAEALERVAIAVRDGATGSSVWDLNGNRVGRFELEGVE